MTPADALQILDMIVERAPALRANGILSVNLDGIAVTLAPAEPEVEPPPSDDEKPPPSDVLRDPATHGMPDGEPVTIRRHRV